MGMGLSGGEYLKQTPRLRKPQVSGVAYAPHRISLRLRLGFCDSPSRGE